MAGKVKTLCQEKVVPVIEQMGYDVVDIEYSKKSDGMNLVFYIDNDQGIQIEDCEKVSKEIDELIEQLNPTDDQPYILSISSPGIDRPLKTIRDYNRNLGKEISITLFSKKNGIKKFEGVLENFDEKTVTIIYKREPLIIEKDKIAHIVPIIKF